MATVIQSPPAPAPDDQHFLLEDVGWNEYVQLLDALGERPGLRSTYDRGTLELMTKSAAHEIWKRLLGRLVEALSFEFDIPVKGGGSFTLQSRKKQRGVEADEWFWIEHEPAIRGKAELDFEGGDPPPDLAIEIEVTRSSLDRHSIYAALGVAELWYFDGRELRVYVLQEDGAYNFEPHSRAFPFLKIDGVQDFLRLDDPRSDNARIRDFLAWVKEQGT